MRSAFKRWKMLHGENTDGYIRIPPWFRWYIHDVIHEREDIYCNRHEMDYTFEISDEELLQLQRPKREY